MTNTAPLGTMEVAKTLVDLCRQGRNDQAIAQLYSPDVVSVEAGSPEPGVSREARGLDAVVAKGTWWVENHIVHDSKVGGPWPHDDRFIVTFTYDITHKPSGHRFVMEEAALFTVVNGKITREEFFYSMG
ncbi:MAG: nuclear transport factor 2 family protein [Gemmatimonadaceae bacterium]|nr:nuclear transport factor 2 family protein [Gemmatimonadaceae bacterium]